MTRILNRLGAGDFGEEAENLVKEIADVDVPKAVILGNHDAWYTLAIQGL